MRHISAVSMGLFFASIVCVTFAEPREHFTVTASPPQATLPRKVLLLPLDLAVYSVGAGGVTERAEDLTKDERTETENMIREEIAKDKHLELVSLPQLDKTAQAQLDEHIALYVQVAGTALLHSGRQDPWPQKVTHFDYTLGNGLRFLKDRTGANAALIVFGEGGVPTLSSYVAGLLPLFVGVAYVPQARATAVVGIVDLETGNLLWLDQAALPGGIMNSVSRVLSGYPDAPGGTAQK